MITIKKFDNIWYLLADMADYTGRIYFTFYCGSNEYAIGALDNGEWWERRISYYDFGLTAKYGDYDLDTQLLFKIKNGEHNNNTFYPYLVNHPYIQQLQNIKAFW